ncbi:MAG: methionyl-tRNA formyltransferase [Robiginitomaculum sp.]|nr:methionyl-tRNA formyltransferase [Robiginitomaculum sp.]MDQ7077967.1 methionyl-tRNA formyltransferase [Robiginitomaculum sp.]
MALRIAFMGTPAFAATALSALAKTDHDIVCVYTQPPRPAGRGKALRQSAVHDLAQSLGLPVRTPKTLRDADEQAAFAALDLDVAVIVAYGLILPVEILQAPRFGCLNLHGSLLPRWRGAAPIQRAIMAGDHVTGVQVMQMEEGLDTGPVLMSESVDIVPDDTAGRLHDKLATAGAALMPKALDALEAGAITAKPQSEDGVTYAHKIDKKEARIDWSRPAEDLDRLIRGLSPFPGAWFELPSPKGPVRIKVLMALPEAGHGAPGKVLDDHLLVACGDGAVRLTRLQRAGKGVQAAEDFLRGQAIPKGTRLA